MKQYRPGLALALAGLVLAAGALGGWYVRRRWSAERIAPVMLALRGVSTSWDRALAATAREVGAPLWYVRWVVGPETYKAGCTEVRPNPWKWANRIIGTASTALLAVFPPTTAFSPLVGAAVAGVDSLIPSARVRPCR